MITVLAENLVLVGGVLNAGFLVFHALFWRLFTWDRDLESLSFVNRQVMQILNLSLMVAFGIFSYVSIFHTSEMLQTPLGRSLLLLIAAFWLLRALQQILFFGLRKPASLVLFLTFVAGGILYGAPWYVTAGT